jgi:hypothetical protein
VKRTSFLLLRNEGKEESGSCRLLQLDSAFEQKGSPATTLEHRCGEPKHLQSFESLHDWAYLWPANVDFHGQVVDTNATISPRSGADRACTSARLASLVTNQSSTVILLIRSEPYVPDSSHTATLESAHMELARVRLSHEKALAGTQLDGLFDTLV